jgi:TPR repeat protein
LNLTESLLFSDSSFLLGSHVLEEHRIDYEAALKYFTSASDQGLVGMSCSRLATHGSCLEAKVNLAFMHLQGRGTKASVWEAAKLFTVAAERGTIDTDLLFMIYLC